MPPLLPGSGAERPGSAAPRRPLTFPRLTAGLLVVVAGLVAACGTPFGPEPPAGPAGRPEPAADSAFPVSVDHSLGRTTVPAPPRRIVALGGNDGDALYALGVEPVAVLGGQGGQTRDGITPWLAGRLDPTRTTVLRTATDTGLERIAALRPDLILAESVPTVGDEYA
jgi:iron complex transport system substrate-binding protein